MKQLLKRYRAAILILILMLMFVFINREMGTKALISAASMIKQMLLLLPPIFILLGLLDVWVPQDIMVKYLGSKSGVKGIVLAILLGSCTSGPLYAAFPVTAVFMKKGVKFSNIMIFLGAWSTTKIPMLLFEGTNLGWEFALTRLLIDIPGIILIAFALETAVSKKDIEKLYQDANHIKEM